MELPQKLTTDLKIVQHQMKLEIQTHQIMRIKQAKDPNNYKLHDDLREIERRISNLGEKQNQLMRWLRKLITSIPSNSALMAKTIATALGISVNGTHPCSGFNPNNAPSSKNCVSIEKKNNVHSPTKDLIPSNGLPTTTPANLKNETDELSDEISIKVESKDKFQERETKSAFKTVPENNSTQGKTVKHQMSLNNAIYQKKTSSSGHKECSLERLSVEKEKFLSAIGLITREILKELQNRRVERKRRSTANHTQFVYGSNWDISSKKRKKSNYLTSSGKQQVTRQVMKVPSPRCETPIISSKLNPTVSIFKTPLPLSNQNQNCPADNVVNSSIPSQKALKSLPFASSVNNEPDSVSSTDMTTSVVIYKCKEGGSCFVCQKPDSNTFACACSISYHQSCAEIVENCVGCGGQLVKGNISERRAEKHRLQETNNRLNNEKQELETRAAELSVTLATQAERKKKLQSLEEDVRKKIQRIHEFVAIVKNSHSVPSS